MTDKPQEKATAKPPAGFKEVKGAEFALKWEKIGQDYTGRFVRTRRSKKYAHEESGLADMVTPDGVPVVIPAPSKLWQLLQNVPTATMVYIVYTHDEKVAAGTLKHFQLFTK